MNARNMFKALVLPLLLACFAGTTGCTQRTIIEEPVTEDSSFDPITSTPNESESAIANHALYVRSGDTQPGETQSGPFPEPWEQRLGPFPEPWQREGTGEGEDGKSPPPPSDPNPNPDPNPKP